jgi:hypothetical protein
MQYLKAFSDTTAEATRRFFWRVSDFRHHGEIVKALKYPDSVELEI